MSFFMLYSSRNQSTLRVRNTQIQTAGVGTARIDGNGVGASDGKRLSRQVECAAARESIRHCCAVGFQQGDTNTTHRVAGNSHGRLLARGPTESQIGRA